MTVAPSLRWFVGLLPIALAVGCGSSGGNGYSLDVGADDSGPSLVLGAGDASVTGAFDAHIEQNHIAVTFVTLSCAGPCADVVAVPTGGQAPYTFKWDDGSTTASRHVCPASSTSYSVKVTDTGTSGELARAAETVQVPLAANVIACPDGGSAGKCDTLVGSISPTGANPSGAWSYGWSSSLGSMFTAFSSFYPPALTGGIDSWEESAITNNTDMFNPTATPYVSVGGLPDGGVAAFTVAAGQFAMLGVGGQFAIARWTAAAAGAYDVTAAFEGISTPQATTAVHVEYNGADVRSGFIAADGGANLVAFRFAVQVAAGDTIDFAVSATDTDALPGNVVGEYVSALSAAVCAAAADGGP